METILANEENEATNGPQQSGKERPPKYQEGQTLRLIRVRFPGHAHSYPFLLGKRALSYGQKVMALSDRGMAIGYVNSFPYEVPYQDKLAPIRTISRVATKEDEINIGKEEGQEKEMEDRCKELIKKHHLEMNLTHVELTGYGKKVVFYFTAPQRVDFRGLVRDLTSQLRMRVELRQISTRERAAALGGLGPCGRALCCSTFLKRYGNVSIKMAKVQNLALIPSKLNGLCGQLKCCLSYEEDVYQEKRGRLPKEQQLIQTANGDQGKVLRLHIIEEQFDMLTEKGVIRRYHWQQFNPQKYPLPPQWKLPENFEHISHDTSQVIGLVAKSSTGPSPFAAKTAVEEPLPTTNKVSNQDQSQNRQNRKQRPKQDQRQDQQNSSKKTNTQPSSSPEQRALKTQKNNPFNKKRKRSKGKSPRGKKR